MKVGDLVKIVSGVGQTISGVKDERRIGTVIRFDFYTGGDSELFAVREPDTIVEVLWNTGHTDWILQDRIRVINELKT